MVKSTSSGSSSAFNMESIVQRTNAAEQEAANISTALNDLARGEIQKLEKDNEKMKYRINILKRAYEEQGKADVSHMRDIVRMLRLYFEFAVSKAFPDAPTVPCQVTVATQAKFGDYQCNVAPPLAGVLKARGLSSLNPREVATEVLKHFPENPEMIEKMEIAGPGFINIFLTNKLLVDETVSIFLNEKVKLAPLSVKKKVVIDMSSPNVAKEMHVGHLRSTIIGESIARLMTFLGYEVVRVNHIGDWGTQFGMLIAHLKDTFPDYLSGNFQFPVKDLQGFYKESKKRFDEDEEFKKRAYGCVVELQSHNPEIIKAWNMICDVSRKEFSKIYDRFDIKNLTEKGESFYQSKMEAVVKDLESKGLLSDDCPEGDGALTGVRKVMFCENMQIPLIIVKSDGGFTYDTSDMATIKYRIEEEKGDWLIYVVDAGQAIHFQTIFACAKKAGIYNPAAVRVDHVEFGVVLGEDKKKFKTRSGDTVRLVDLLDEGIKRSEEKLREKGRDKEMTPEEFEEAKAAVAYSCIKYADLSHNRIHEYVFSFDKMLDDKGNTAVYLLYAYARIKAIARKAGVTLDQLKEYAKTKPINLPHEKEKKLMKTILRFPETIERATNDLLLHPICELLYDIATSFSEFYDNCYCIEKDSEGNTKKIHMERLILCEATATVLKTGFDIIGLKCLGKM